MYIMKILLLKTNTQSVKYSIEYSEVLIYDIKGEGLRAPAKVTKEYLMSCSYNWHH